MRLHPDEAAYWSPELCFANVPIKGQKRDTLHLIDEELAMRYLPPARILRFRLALATKPQDVFFLCHVPTRNEDNTWVASNLIACEQAKTHWTQATSRGRRGLTPTRRTFARDADAFPEPNWPTQSLDELIDITFAGRMIEHRGSSRPAAPDRRPAVDVVSGNFGTVVVCDFEYEAAPGDLPTSCAWWRTCWMRTFSTCAPSACGVASLARRRRSTSDPTRCSSPIAPGPR